MKVYSKGFDVLPKSEEQLQKERHAQSLQRAALVESTRGPHSQKTVQKAPLVGVRISEWGTEEVLLCGLILWQFLQKERDYLLIGILVFLLLID